jgi:hypothetical protein
VQGFASAARRPVTAAGKEVAFCPAPSRGTHDTWSSRQPRFSSDSITELGPRRSAVPTAIGWSCIAGIRQRKTRRRLGVRGRKGSVRLAAPALFQQPVVSFLRGRRQPGRGSKTQHRRTVGRTTIALRGVMLCGLCGRRMSGKWNNGQAYYLCRFPTEYALANRVSHPEHVYLKEADVLGQLAEQATRLVNPAVHA